MTNDILILQHIIGYLETEDEKFLNDKYIKSTRFQLMNLLERLNIPDFEIANIGEYKRGYNKGYLDGVILTLKLWLEKEQLMNKGKQEELTDKKNTDQKEIDELKALEEM